MDPNTPTAPPADPPAPTDPPAEPPATRVVLNAEKSERELNLEKELADEKSARKQVEMKAAELEDQNSQLKKIPTNTPAPTPNKRRKKGIMEEFFYGADEPEA